MWSEIVVVNFGRKIPSESERQDSFIKLPYCLLLHICWDTAFPAVCTAWTISNEEKISLDLVLMFIIFFNLKLQYIYYIYVIYHAFVSTILLFLVNCFFLMHITHHRVQNKSESIIQREGHMDFVFYANNFLDSVIRNICYNHFFVPTILLLLVNCFFIMHIMNHTVQDKSVSIIYRGLTCQV